jgi:hypothetical protein
MKFLITTRTGIPVIEVVPSQMLSKFVPEGSIDSYRLQMVKEDVHVFDLDDRSKLTHASVDWLNEEGA